MLYNADQDLKVFAGIEFVASIAQLKREKLPMSDTALVLCVLSTLINIPMPSKRSCTHEIKLLMFIIGEILDHSEPNDLETLRVEAILQYNKVKKSIKNMAEELTGQLKDKNSKFSIELNESKIENPTNKETLH